MRRLFAVTLAVCLLGCGKPAKPAHRLLAVLNIDGTDTQCDMWADGSETCETTILNPDVTEVHQAPPATIDYSALTSTTMLSVNTPIAHCEKEKADYYAAIVTQSPARAMATGWRSIEGPYHAINGYLVEQFATDNPGTDTTWSFDCPTTAEITVIAICRPDDPICQDGCCAPLSEWRNNDATGPRCLSDMEPK